MTTEPFDDRVRACVFAPILVVGAPRSGTTAVQRLLLADPRFVGGQESHFFASLGPMLRDFDRKRSMPRPHGLACYWTRGEAVAHLRALWLDAFARAVRTKPSALSLVEKTPDHALWLDVAAEVLPEARVVHVVRDSRAVVASLLRAGRSEWGRAWAPKSLDAAVAIWRRHVEAALATTLAAHIVRAEDLVDDPRREAAALHGFAVVGGGPIEVDPAALADGDGSTREFAAGGMIGRTPDEPDGFTRPAAEARDGWRTELGWWSRRRVWNATADLMERLGYARAGRERPR